MKGGALCGKDIDGAIVPSRWGMDLADLQDRTLGRTGADKGGASPP